MYLGFSTISLLGVVVHLMFVNTLKCLFLGVHKKSSLQLRCSQPWASDAEAQGLNLTSSILNCGNGLELAYNRGSCILLLVPCTTLECKQVLVSYQEYECGLLSSKSAKIDSAFRKQHFPFAYLLCNTPCLSRKFCITFVFNSPWYYSLPKRNWRQCVY